jgi:uncharacterized protein with von Willebrand factor type A (vWA) domain
MVNRWPLINLQPDGARMKRYRYSEWDGRQAFADIQADDVLDEAVDDLLQHGDLTWALRRLFEQGLNLRGGRRVEGIRDLLKRLQRMKQEAAGQFDMQSLFDALRQQIQQLSQEHLSQMNRMLQALNELLQQRDRGEQPALDDFLKQFGHYFPNLEQADLDALLEELQAEDLPFLVIDGVSPGTNLQHGFMLARKWLARQSGPNKQIIVITDGQPTVHHEKGQWIFRYPPTMATLQETLREVKRVTDSGIQLSVFMLDDDPTLVAFVDQMTRINRGRAFYVTSETLGKYLLVDYLRKKRVRV